MKKTILILVVPALILSLSLMQLNDVNATVPTHHWNFEEGSGTTANDQSGTEDGIIHGGTWTDSSVVGGALIYDGVDDYVALPGGTDAFSKYTISLWFNASALSGRQFLYQEGGNDNGINLYLLNNKLYAGVYSETYGFNGQWIQHQNSVTSGWHFVTVVYNSIDHYFQLYLDGVRTAINFSPDNIGQEVNGAILTESGVGTEIYRHVGKASIGSMLDYTIIETGEVNNPGTDYFFNGIIDEVKLYHGIAISLADVQNEYSAGQCSEDTWVCGDWGSCTTEGEQFRECSLISDCVFVDTPLPDTTQACEYAPECTEDIWECGSWEECLSSGLQSRNCEIVNECSNVNTPSPDTTQSCIYIPTTCSSWNYSGWGECNNGEQTREVTSAYPSNCSGGSPVISQSCEINSIEEGTSKPATRASFYFVVEKDSYSIGDILEVQVKVGTNGLLNKTEGVINYDSDFLQTESVDIENSIANFWTVVPTYHNERGLSFGGASTDGFDSGLIFSFKVKVIKSGNVSIHFSSGAAISKDGKGTNILNSMGSLNLEVDGVQEDDLRPDITKTEEENEGGSDKDELDFYENNANQLALKLQRQISNLEKQVIELEKKLTLLDQKFAEKYAGTMFLDVENYGRLWYVDPKSKNRFYFENGKAALSIGSRLAIGITYEDIQKIPVGIPDKLYNLVDSDNDGLPDRVESALGTDPNKADTDGDGYSDKEELENGYNPVNNDKYDYNQSLIDRLEGKMLLQVAGSNSHGEIWYIKDGQRWYGGTEDSMYEIMKARSLGAISIDIRKIKVGDVVGIE